MNSATKLSPMPHQDPKTRTPCIGICSTVFGDEVCRGCKRFSHEVIDWNRYDNHQKRLIWDRLEQLLTQVMSKAIEVTDANQLRAQLDHHRVPFNPALTPYCWAYELLCKGHRQLTDLTPFGIDLLPPYRGMNPDTLYHELSQDYYCLSQAYYEANVVRHQASVIPDGTLLS